MSHAVESPSSPAELWSMALEQPYVSSAELADAIAGAVENEPLDFRTRLLIRDSLNALRELWGPDAFGRWMNASSRRTALEGILASDLGPAGFSLLAHRIMDPTRIDSVMQLFRELGQSIRTSSRITVGGSIALILGGTLARRTEVIDIVDEIPVEIRSEHELLNRLAVRYGLRLTHFQSHYLPTGWATRLREFGTFGRLEVDLVDFYDIFLSKVFSSREKDRDDLRALIAHIDRKLLTQRLLQTTEALQKEPSLQQQAKDNWYILFGESLPE